MEVVCEGEQWPHVPLLFPLLGPPELHPAALLFSQMRGIVPWALCVCSPFLCDPVSPTSAWIALVHHWSLSSEVTSSARLEAVFFKTAKLLPPYPYTLFPSLLISLWVSFSLTLWFSVYSLSSVFSYCSHPHHENFMVKFMWTLCRSILFMSVCRKTCLSVFFCLVACWNIEAFLFTL